MNSKVPFKVKLQLGLEFIQFLKNRSDNNTYVQTREELKSLYTQHFSQILDPTTQLPPFSGVLGALVRTKRIQKLDEQLLNYSGRRPSRPSVGPDQRVAHQGEMRTAPATDIPSPPSTRRRRRIAVDQHVHPLAPNVQSTQDNVRYEGGYFYCSLCEVRTTTRAQMDSHLGGRKHRRIGLVKALSKNRDSYVCNKENIRICSEFDDDDKMGNVCFEFEPSKQTKIKLTIHNDSTTDVLIVHKCEMLKRARVFKVKDVQKVAQASRSCSVEPKESCDVTVVAHAKHMGTYTFPLAFFMSRGSDTDMAIRIVRYIRGRCVNELVQELMPRVPYKRPPRVNQRRTDLEIVDGFRPPSEKKANQLEQEEPIGKYGIPDALRTAVNHGLEINSNLSDTAQKHLDKIRKLLKSPLSPTNHAEKFSVMLHIEEIQMEVDIHKYDMEDAVLQRCKTNRRLLNLKVPGLAENRPSVLKGDCLYVRHKQTGNQNSEKEYKGYVHEVHQNSVDLGFGDSFTKQHIDNMKYDVRFTFNRLPLRVQHRALKLVEENSLYPILFPGPETICTKGTMLPLDLPLKLYDAKLENNPQQVAAVKHILCGTSRPAPYVVFGPPGTGKTVTIVEAIKQVIRNVPGSCVLACAPSNSAVDLLTERLMDHIDKREIIRLNAQSRIYSTIPEKIRPCCNYNKADRDFEYPRKDELKKFRVIASTLVTAARLASANFPPGHFSHVFVDEAGQAVEPEAVIALGNIIEIDIDNKYGGQVVLAGDPKQLGPIIRSPIAINFGLGISLLERYILQMDPYRRKEDASCVDEAYNSRILTKLVRNYRSHPVILRLPNDYFYDNELQVYADKLVRESLCQWAHLPRKNFPLIFHGVCGEDEREERSPSFFNSQEAVKVLDYVQMLLEIKAPTVKPKDIGVISPYRKQVQKIRQLFEKKKLKEIKIGSVEEFQGQEHKVIIISTVRSNPDYLSGDVAFNLGFLKNPKRFNVAVTRAKALLVVIGNPFILSKDPNWNGFLEYCLDNDAYTGCEYIDSDTEEEEIVQKLSDLTLSDTDAHCPGDISETTYQLDPPWRAEN